MNIYLVVESDYDQYYHYGGYTKHVDAEARLEEIMKADPWRSTLHIIEIKLDTHTDQQFL